MGVIRFFLMALLLPSASQEMAQPSAPSSRNALSPGEHQVMVSDVRLWYRVAGRRNGTPVVYLHGGPGQGSQSFAHFVGPSLERTNRVIYLDQRGAGRSDRPANGPYSIELMVEDLERLRQAWGVQRIDLIGHSFGTILAMEYGARYPEHVSHIVLAAGVNDIQKAFDIQCQRLASSDPAAYQRAVAARSEDWRARCNMMRAYSGAESERILSSYMFPDPATADRLKVADEANGLGNTGVVGAALFRQGLLNYRFEGARRLTMPVMIIAGTRDLQSVIELHRDFVRELPRARLLEYQGAGHFMWVEQPQRFASDVADFLRTR